MAADWRCQHPDTAHIEMAGYPAETPIMVCLSLHNLSFDGKMLNVPLFMVDQLDRLLALALQ